MNGLDSVFMMPSQSICGDGTAKFRPEWPRNWVRMSVDGPTESHARIQRGLFESRDFISRLSNPFSRSDIYSDNLIPQRSASQSHRYLTPLDHPTTGASPAPPPLYTRLPRSRWRGRAPSETRDSISRER